MGIVPVIKQNLSDNIKRDLKKYILDMDLQKSAKLPSEIEIGKLFGVSRVTVRRALDELEQENLILRIHGRGTFVNPDAAAMKISLNYAQEFCHLIHLGGYEPEIKLGFIGVTKEEKRHSRNLQLDNMAELYKIEKIYFADRHPAIVCIDYIPTEIFREEPTKQEWIEVSSFEILRKYAGKILTRDKIELQALTIDEMKLYTESADLMECKSVLKFDNIMYDQENQPAISGIVFFDTKYVRYNLLRNVEPY